VRVSPTDRAELLLALAVAVLFALLGAAGIRTARRRLRAVAQDRIPSVPRWSFGGSWANRGAHGHPRYELWEAIGLLAAALAMVAVLLLVLFTY
jgi:hypothetical protein